MGWINVSQKFFLWWLMPLTFCGGIPTHLDLQWDLRNFYPERFFKVPTLHNLQCLWYIGCLCRIYNLHFGLIQKSLSPSHSVLFSILSGRIQRGAPGLK